MKGEYWNNWESWDNLAEIITYNDTETIMFREMRKIHNTYTSIWDMNSESSFWNNKIIYSIIPKYQFTHVDR